jgi:hypothetical protein
MSRLLFPVVLAGLGLCGAAMAQPQTPATAAALRSAAFAPRTADRIGGGGVEQKLGFGGKRPFHLYVGASGAGQELREDPRWRDDHETRSSNSLVNTRFGVGWERDNTRVSLGYLRRQLPNPGGALGAKPRRDSMVGLSLSIHPDF